METGDDKEGIFSEVQENITRSNGDKGVGGKECR